FQAEDGIRDRNVTGVQTCALPILLHSEVGVPNPDGTADPETQTTLVLPENSSVHFDLYSPDVIHSFWIPAFGFKMDVIPGQDNRSEERRVGKAGRQRWAPERQYTR